MPVTRENSKHQGVTPASPDDDRSGMTRAIDVTLRKSLGLMAVNASLAVSQHDANGVNFDTSGRSPSFALSSPLKATGTDASAGMSTGMTK